ncbi:MAG: hypothetical protein RPR97_10040 [Colwellia sp.]
MPAFEGTTLTDEEFITKVAEFIGKRENTTGDYNAHYDGKNSIAIGYGLDLLENDTTLINSYLVASGIAELTEEQITQLNNIDENRDLWTKEQFDTAATNLGIDLSEAQAGTLLFETLETYRTDLTNTLALSNITIEDLPNSSMRVALLDLIYNGGPSLIGPNLRGAIRNSIEHPERAHVFRAAAWVEIRYFSNGDRNDPNIKGNYSPPLHANKPLTGF